LLASHPAFETSRSILDEMFAENRVDGQFATEAMRREAQRESLDIIANKNWGVLSADTRL